SVLVVLMAVAAGAARIAQVGPLYAHDRITSLRSIRISIASLGSEWRVKCRFKLGRSGREAEGGGLENRWSARGRRFESCLLRHPPRAPRGWTKGSIAARSRRSRRLHGTDAKVIAEDGRRGSSCGEAPEAGRGQGGRSAGGAGRVVAARIRVL